MEIGLTEEVRKMCGLRPLPKPADSADPLFCWDLARIDFGTRELLVLSNVATNALGITRMTPADWKHIDNVALRLIEDALKCCECNPRNYLPLASKISITKTHGRQAVSNMMMLAGKLAPDEMDMMKKTQWRQMYVLNHQYLSRCVSYEGYGYPAMRLEESLAATAPSTNLYN